MILFLCALLVVAVLVAAGMVGLNIHLERQLQAAKRPIDATNSSAGANKGWARAADDAAVAWATYGKELEEALETQTERAEIAEALLRDAARIDELPVTMHDWEADGDV